MTTLSDEVDLSTPSERSRRPTKAVVVLVATVVAAIGAGALLVGGADEQEEAAEGGWNGEVRDEAVSRPSFVLTDAATGEPYDFAAETEGRLTLLFFGYLSCPDVCPVHFATLSAALERTTADPLVVFVSIDPAEDEPEEIRAWLDDFDEDFVGLTGTAAELEQAQEAARVPPATIEGEGDDRIVAHSSEIIAYTPDDRSYITYPFGTRSAAWVEDLPRLSGDVAWSER